MSANATPKLSPTTIALIVTGIVVIVVCIICLIVYFNSGSSSPSPSPSVSSPSSSPSSSSSSPIPSPSVSESSLPSTPTSVSSPQNTPNGSAPPSSSSSSSSSASPALISPSSSPPTALITPSPSPSAAGELGGACVVHTDCKGYGAGSTDMACCEGKCTKKLPDWSGIGYCPHECTSGPAGIPGSEPGTCAINHWPRLPNEPCASHTDCKGYGANSNDMACCQGKCTQKLKDWAGTGYCPHECTSGPAGIPGSEPGTCAINHWPRLVNEPCAQHTDCAGYGAGPNDVACCKGICKRKLKDWAGVGYCPEECVGRAGGPAGSC